MHILFPARSYAATTGNWNLVVSHHNDGGYQAFPCSRELANLVLDVVTDYPVVANAVGKNPRLKLRVMGGATCSPRTTWYDLGKLKLGHWYDLLYRVTWSTRPSMGRLTAWIDGTRKVFYRGPTLYERPDGTTSYTFLDLLNYRLHATWSSTIYFGKTLIGASRATVSGSRARR